MSDSEHWAMFTDDLTDSFTDRVEHMRRAALFREMSAADQLTSILSAQIASILYVVHKSRLDDEVFDSLHKMLEMGRAAMKAGAAPGRAR